MNQNLPPKTNEALGYPEELTPEVARHAVSIISTYNRAYAGAEGSLDYECRDELDLLSDGSPFGDGASIRDELIDTYLPALERMGLGLATPTDLGRDEYGGKTGLGRHLVQDPEKPLPLAVEIIDGSTFIQTLDALSDEDGQLTEKDAWYFAHLVCRDAARLIRGGYASHDEQARAHAERLVVTIASILPALNGRERAAKRSGNTSITLNEYVKRYEEGTLEDYLGAERRDIVTQEDYTYGPGRWGYEIGFKPLYTPAELRDKWQEALAYLKELQAKQSPLFDELFPSVRNDFESSLTWLSEHGRKPDELEKAAILKELEPVWSSEFPEAGGIYQLEKAAEATGLAQYALSYGLDPEQVPELPAQVDEASVTAARGLIRDQVKHLFAVAEQLPVPMSDFQYGERQDSNNIHHIFNHLSQNRLRYYRDERTNTRVIGVPQFEIQLNASPNRETVIIDKEISRQAQNAGGKGVRLEAIIDANGIRARLRNEHVSGVVHYNHWLTPAEAIQAATAMVSQFENEAAHFAK